MKKGTIFLGMALYLFSAGIISAQEAPVAISPGSEVGIAKVGTACPTFSWTSVDGAAAYRVEVFKAMEGAVLSHMDMERGTYPVLVKEIRGAATSWTPSSDQRLAHDGQYVWYVQAIDAYGAGAWSRGETFKVDVRLSFSPIEETLSKTLEEHGVNQDIIGDVLESVRAEVVKGKDGGQVETADGATPIGIQGNETGNNTYYGENAGFSLTEGRYNSFFGQDAGYGTSAGVCNTFVGRTAGRDNTTGRYNTMIGAESGERCTIGNYNTFLGAETGCFNKGSSNVFIGYEAGFLNNGSRNVFIGFEAGHMESGSHRLLIESGRTSDPLIYGEFDNDVLAFMATVGIGTKSPSFPFEMKKTGVNASIVVDRTDGATSYINATATSGNIGTVTNHPIRLVADGRWRMRINTDNSLTMKNGATCTTGGVWTNASSRDLKDDIHDLSADRAIEALNDLQPVTYKYKADMEDEHVGFIAEDVPDLVASKDRKGMSPMDVVAVLTKVLQEQQRNNQEQQKMIDGLKQELEKLKAKSNEK